MRKFLIMALTLTMALTVGSYSTSFAHNIEIESGFREIGDRAVIELPNLAGKLEQSFRIGDPVEIQLGYDDQNSLEFSGYVAEISPRIPFKMVCEDGLYIAKRTQVQPGSWKSMTLAELIAHAAGPNVLLGDIPQVTLKPYRIEQGSTLAQVLDKLKEDYMLVAYYRGNKLFVGLPYTEFSAANTPLSVAWGRYASYRLHGDLANVVSADELTWRFADQVKLQAKAVSILPDNTRIEATVGDSDGEQRSLFFRNITTKADLEAIATAELARLKYDGYAGSIETFGTPRVIHGATASLQDERYPARSGEYLVDKVTTRWGLEGFRRVVELGPAV